MASNPDAKSGDSETIKFTIESTQKESDSGKGLGFRAEGLG